MSTTSINFILSHLESETTLGTLATVYYQSDMPEIESDARAVIYVTEENAKKIFKIRTDAADVVDADPSDIEFYVYDDDFTALEINPANAMMDAPDSENPVSLSDKSSNPYPADKSLVAHDFVRHLAKDMFGSHIGVDLFNNELALLQNIREKCGLEGENVMEVINASVKKVSVNSTETVDGLEGEAGSKYMTNANVLPENLCRELFNQMISLEPSRFANLDEASDDTEPRPLPFFPGDSINFKLTINPAEGQQKITRGDDGTPVAARSYEIRLLIIADDDAEKVNTEVAADEVA